MTNNYMIGDSGFVKGLKSKSVILAGIGAVGTALAYFATADKHHFMASYLLAFVYFLGISVTSVFFSALQFLVRAGWSASIRRIVEMFTGLVPWLALGFIPIAIDILSGHSLLYHWAHHTEEVLNDPVLQAKSLYLDQAFFLGRLALYCGVWWFIRRVIVGNSLKQDQADDYTPTKKNMKRSAPLVILYALTFTFAGFDLLMSVEPHWFSTMFGVYFFAGNFVSTISMLTIFTIVLYRGGYLKGFVTEEHFHDLGKLLFAFTVFWMYISFSQYFLIWYANIPEETEFFIHRTHTSWQWIGWTLLLLHFILPFAILLQQKVKRNLNALLFVSVLTLLMHLVDMSWMVMPVFGESLFFAWQVIPLFLLFLGLFLFTTAQQFAKHPMIAYNDPYIQESKDLVS